MGDFRDLSGLKARAEQVRREEPIYGVSTGFGSNADKLLGAHPLRDELPGAAPSGRSLHAELQRNLIVTHAVCVGEPMPADVVRAMLCIRINTLLRGHSGIRVETLQALTAMLNAGVVPVVPSLGSVGASGDLAPLSHLAIVLLGGGEALLDGERMPGGEALARALSREDMIQVAENGLGIRRARVEGQFWPGQVSLFSAQEAPDEVLGTPYVVFPGNVGGEEALADVVDVLAAAVSAR